MLTQSWQPCAKKNIQLKYLNGKLCYFKANMINFNAAIFFEVTMNR